MAEFRIIAVIVGTFLVTVATSALLEIPFFQNYVRYALVIFLIGVELYFGYLLFKYFTRIVEPKK